MRRIEPTNSFKRDYKRELKGKHKTVLGSEFVEMLQLVRIGSHSEFGL
jgi:mRNA-degrading endonuclease YafQ of YafQ-DinJ toxin-antitoxin module